MIKDILKTGFILKSNGYYKNAIETFYKALEIDNSSNELLLEIAETYYLMDEEQCALDYIEQILNHTPTHIESLKLLQKIFLNKKAWSEAEQTAKNIYFISKSPKDLAEIFKILNIQHNYTEIFEYNIPEYSPEILYELAYAKMFNNEPEEGLGFIDKALEIQPENIEAEILKAKILFKLDRKDDCAKLLSEYNQDDDNPELINFSGLVKQHRQDFPAALECFKKAIKLNPQASEYYYNCASTYFKMDEISLAKEYYNKAILLDPNNPNYHLALANLYYSQKQYKRALDELQDDSAEAGILKAAIYYDMGHKTLAKINLDMVKDKAQGNPIVQEYLEKIKLEFAI